MVSTIIGPNHKVVAIIGAKRMNAGGGWAATCLCMMRWWTRTSLRVLMFHKIDEEKDKNHYNGSDNSERELAQYYRLYHHYYNRSVDAWIGKEEEGMPNIITLVEGPRGCGYRKECGYYMMLPHFKAESCGKLPLPLEQCPCCGQGIKFSR